MNGWARNSRFWKIAPWVVLLSAGLSVYFSDLSSFTTIATVFMTVAGGKSIVSTYTGTEPTALLPPHASGPVAPPMMPVGEGPNEYQGDPPGGET